MVDERDPEVTRRYRELGGEEPPPKLDASILAVSRRGVAPRRRWYVPLATAAILILAVTVTIHVEREQRNPEAITTLPQEPRTEEIKPLERAPEAPKASKREPAPRVEDSAGAAKAPAPGFTPEPKPQPQEALREPASGAAPAVPEIEPRAKQESARDVARGEREFRFQERAPAPGAAAVPQTAPVPQAAPAPQVGGTSTPARKPAQADAIEESPERWLERIAELRKQGRHEEADQALAQFRQRYPDYRISESMLEKIEKR